MKLSPHLTLAEVTKSDTAIRLGIDNTPKPHVMLNLANIANDIFEPCRAFIGGPLGVTSGYRSPELNKAIGGSTTSQHCEGEALDIDCDVFGIGNNADLFHFIRTNLNFDQLIWEFGNSEKPDWVHVSLRGLHVIRKQVLVAYKENGVTKYKKWDESK